MSHNSLSIGDLLIATLGSARSTRRFYSIIRERKFKRYKKESVRVGLSRLHKKGYLSNSSSGWFVTKKGKKYSKNARLLDYAESPFEKDSSDDTIIAFDIPDKNFRLQNAATKFMDRPWSASIIFFKTSGRFKYKKKC